MYYQIPIVREVRNQHWFDYLKYLPLLHLCSRAFCRISTLVVTFEVGQKASGELRKSSNLTQQDNLTVGKVLQHTFEAQ